MDFNNSLFGMLFITGLVFALLGFLMYRFPPKKINMFYGYKTATSMKNQKQWDFAQKYSGKLMVYNGFILIVISFVSLFFNIEEKIETFIGIGFILTCIFIILFFTEKAIKQQFKNEE